MAQPNSPLALPPPKILQRQFYPSSGLRVTVRFQNIWATNHFPYFTPWNFDSKIFDSKWHHVEVSFLKDPKETSLRKREHVTKYRKMMMFGVAQDHRQGHEEGEGLKIGRVNQKPSLQQFFKIYRVVLQSIEQLSKISVMESSKIRTNIVMVYWYRVPMSMKVVTPIKYWCMMGMLELGKP